MTNINPRSQSSTSAILSLSYDVNENRTLITVAKPHYQRVAVKFKKKMDAYNIGIIRKKVSYAKSC